MRCRRKSTAHLPLKKHGCLPVVVVHNCPGVWETKAAASQVPKQCEHSKQGPYLRKQKGKGGGWRDGWLSSRLLSFLSEDPGSVPSKYDRWLTSTCTQFQGIEYPLPSASSYTHVVHITSYIYTYVHLKNIDFKTRKEETRDGESEVEHHEGLSAPVSCVVCVEFCGDLSSSAKSGLR